VTGRQAYPGSHTAAGSTTELRRRGGMAGHGGNTGPITGDSHRCRPRSGRHDRISCNARNDCTITNLGKVGRVRPPRYPRIAVGKSIAQGVWGRNARAPPGIDWQLVSALAPARPPFDWLATSERGRRSALRLVRMAVRSGWMDGRTPELMERRRVLVEALATLVSDPSTPARDVLAISRIFATMCDPER
jgi:hypothetical protein